MTTLPEKLSLLQEMICFAVIDGKIHDREYGFIILVANELGVDKLEIKRLFQNEINPTVLVSEFDRIQQFYRLALLMYVDGILHIKEDNALHEIGIKMGLDPTAMKQILKMLKQNKNCVIDGEILIKTFAVQNN
ncbi:MAG: hypothetical protein RLZZ312_1494 [Bacteroidota bacterium]|jgi:uncharacterized membrane protein YebE (DUF533 family)